VTALLYGISLRDFIHESIMAAGEFSATMIVFSLA
jgi:hypothetical protein